MQGRYKRRALKRPLFDDARQNVRRALKRPLFNLYFQKMERNAEIRLNTYCEAILDLELNYVLHHVMLHILRCAASKGGSTIRAAA
jgi:hypothetical protein